MVCLFNVTPYDRFRNPIPTRGGLNDPQPNKYPLNSDNRKKFKETTTNIAIPKPANSNQRFHLIYRYASKSPYGPYKTLILLYCLF